MHTIFLIISIAGVNKSNVAHMEMIWNTRLQVIFVIFSAKFEIAAPIRMDETRSIFRELNTFT